jgi:hypothetical protein
MVKRNCTRARTRVRHSSREGNLADKPNLTNCTRDLLEIKLRLETVLEAVGIAVDVLNAQPVEIDGSAALTLRRSVRDALAEPTQQLSRMVRVLEGLSGDGRPGAAEHREPTH